MNTQDPLARFRQQLMTKLVARERWPRPNPVPVSPWMAMSALQKSIRRGRTDIALDAAATLLRDAPDRLWRRIAVAAHEDIGIAAPLALGEVSAAMTGKRFRTALGGDWKVTVTVIETLCAAPKSRASDDLLMTVDAHPDLAEARQTFPRLPEDELARIVQFRLDLMQRALALWFLLGTDRPGGTLPKRRGNPARAFEALDQMGVSPTMLALARQSYSRTGEPLAPLVALLSLENGLKHPPVDDPQPPEVMTGPVPGWAVDMYTRQGKEALGRLLETGAGSAAFAKAHLPRSKQVRFLGGLLFRIEGGVLAQRLGGALSDRLRHQMSFETLGVDPLHAVAALDLMREDLPLLNRIRAAIMGRANDAH